MRPDKLAFDIATKTDVIYEKIKQAQVTTISNTSSLEHQFLNFHFWILKGTQEIRYDTNSLNAFWCEDISKCNLYFYETSVPNLIGIKGFRSRLQEKFFLKG